MRIIIIGAVAAGTSAATEARRNNKDVEIVIYEKDSFISYAGCGMPYYISDEVKHIESIMPRDTIFFKSKHNIDIFTMHEVLSINKDDRTLKIKNLSTGDVFCDTYDKLVIATGAISTTPSIVGIDSKYVFTLRNINDMKNIKLFINKEIPKYAAIIGSGFIGLEMCESLKNLGINVTLIVRSSISKGLDRDMTVHIKNQLEKNGVTVLMNATPKEIKNNNIILSDDKIIKADIVIIATGIKPNVELAVGSGIELGATGAIKVDKKMKTNIEGIYSCGDCIEQFHILTNRPIYRPLGSTANKTGTIAGNSITGGNLEFKGILGTMIYRIFDMTVAQTGLSERDAIEQGYDIVVSHDSKTNKPEYMNGKTMIIKAIAQKSSGILLGAQIIGYEGVDKRIDVFATAITLNAKAEDLIHLDLAYSPPFSIARDPLYYTGIKLNSALK